MCSIAATHLQAALSLGHERSIGISQQFLLGYFEHEAELFENLAEIVEFPKASTDHPRR